MCDCNKQIQAERKPHVHADVIKGYAEGYTVQARVEAKTGVYWVDCHQPMFHEDTVYRVKPEPKPLTDLEKYGVEVGDVWVTCGHPTKYVVSAMSVNGERASTLTVGSARNGHVNCANIPLSSFEKDTLLFRRGVVNRL